MNIDEAKRIVDLDSNISRHKHSILHLTHLIKDPDDQWTPGAYSDTRCYDILSDESKNKVAKYILKLLRAELKQFKEELK